MENRISVVINTRNEEKNLPAVIKSVKGIADEVIVVDMESEDDTVKVAKKLGARTFKHRNTGYVEPARNFAIGKAKNEWVLILDADERVSERLAKKIKESVSEKFDYYAIPRKNILFGKWLKHSRWWPDYNIRLFKKHSVKWEDDIHSVPITIGDGTDFPPKEKYAIEHNNYTTIDAYINRMNRYTTIQSRDLIHQGYEFKWQDLVSKPSAEFVSRFWSGKGYKDGIHGLVVALLQSFSEVVVYAKVWQEGGFTDEAVSVDELIDEKRRVRKEENYWFANTKLQFGNSFINKLRRKFKV